MTLTKLLILSEPDFSHLREGGGRVRFHRNVVGLNEVLGVPRARVCWQGSGMSDVALSLLKVRDSLMEWGPH